MQRVMNTFINQELNQFTRAYPEIVLEITSSNDHVDLVAEEYDAGVQLDEFIQRDMIAVRVTKEMRLAVVGHSCIGFRFSNGLYRWEFEKSRKALTVSPQGLRPDFARDPAATRQTK